MKKYLVCSIAVMLCLYSCRKQVESVTISDKEVELVMGESESYQLKAEVNPKRAAKELVWETNRKNVAIVNENGMVQAKGPGYCIITAKAGDKSDACKVWVYDGSSDLQGLEINKDTAILYEGQRQQFTCAVKPSFISVKLAWSSSDTSVLKVDQTGMVTACKAGAARITVKAGDKSDKCDIVIKPIGMTMDKTKDTMVVTEQHQMKLTLTPALSSVQTVWTSSNTSVATVSATGMVTAVGNGVATIKAAIGSSTAQCALVVNSAVITLPSSKSVYECRNYTLDYTIRPASAASQIKWTSDSDSVTVSNGVCTLKHGPAKAVITATYKEITANCTISVVATGLAIDVTSLTLTKEQTHKLNISTHPAGDSSKVMWKTSNSSIATVSNKGLVTAVSAGTAYITATLNGNRVDQCMVKVKSADITINKDSIRTLIGCKDTIKATVVPASSASSLTWTSSNTSVATVNSSGVVTGVSAGTTYITAAVGSEFVSCKVVVESGIFYTTDNYRVYKNCNLFYTLSSYSDCPTVMGGNVYYALAHSSGGTKTIQLYKGATKIGESSSIYAIKSIDGLSVCSDGTVYIAARVQDASGSTYNYRVYKYTGSSSLTAMNITSSTSIKTMMVQGVSSSTVYTCLQGDNTLYTNTTGTTISGTIDCMALYPGTSNVYMAGQTSGGTLIWMKNGVVINNHGMGTKPILHMAVTTSGIVFAHTDGEILLNGSVVKTGLSKSAIKCLAAKGTNYYYIRTGTVNSLYKNGEKIYSSNNLGTDMLIVE